MREGLGWARRRLRPPLRAMAAPPRRTGAPRRAWVCAVAGSLSVVAMAACGPAPAAVHIPGPAPTASPTRVRTVLGAPERPATTATPMKIAPGVAAPASDVAPPRFTVSRRHPPPPGTPVSVVVADFLRDNYIENVAIERDDPRLLRYADGGRFLLAEQRAVAAGAQQGLRGHAIRDRFTDIRVGTLVDPGRRQVAIAIYASGVEWRVAEIAGQLRREVYYFHDLFWCAQSQPRGPYLLVDSAVLP